MDAVCLLSAVTCCYQRAEKVSRLSAALRLRTYGKQSRLHCIRIRPPELWYSERAQEARTPRHNKAGCTARCSLLLLLLLLLGPNLLFDLSARLCVCLSIQLNRDKRDVSPGFELRNRIVWSRPPIATGLLPPSHGPTGNLGRSSRLRWGTHRPRIFFNFYFIFREKYLDLQQWLGRYEPNLVATVTTSLSEGCRVESSSRRRHVSPILTLGARSQQFSELRLQDVGVWVAGWVAATAVVVSI